MASSKPLPHFPNGWFKVAFSSELPHGKSLLVQRFARDVAIIRHMGGAPESLETDGVHADIPRPTIEHDGAIYCWFDQFGRAPFYEITKPSAHDQAIWAGPYLVRRVLPMHIQETIDNLVDRAHFSVIHDRMRQSTPITLTKVGQHRIDARYRVTLDIFGIKKEAHFHTTINGVGQARVRVRGPLNFDVVSVPTPIDETFCAFDLMIFVRRSSLKTLTWLKAKYITYQVINDTKLEMTIMSHKKFLHRPMMTEADGPIMPLRRWVKRFYDQPLIDRKTAMPTSESAEWAAPQG